ncbi:hypothetical protein [Streptomyces arboris]|uniref:hypothetical protein n=1 Tax=Streptomyces arboris TaxID=2600619 RepID=UPI003BF60471
MIKFCECGKRIESSASHATYCSQACRQSAYRERKAAESPRKPLAVVPTGNVPEDDREALRAVYRAAIAAVLTDGLTVSGRRGEAEVAHPLARFLAPWLTALERSGVGSDLDNDIAALLAAAESITGVASE